MDEDRFDSVIRNLGAGASRRRMLGSLLGAALLGLRHGPESEAKRKPKRRKAAHKDKTKNNKQKHQQRGKKNAKRKPDGAQTEAVTDACKRLCELVYPAGLKRERCLQRVAAHQDLCECVNFCRRVYPRDLRRQLACLEAAAEGDADGLCLQCGADPERHCAGACCAAPGQCVNGACDGGQDPCAGTNCDDGDACTTDSCDPATGACVHTPVDCNDDNACTIDSCDPQEGCVHIEDPDCDGCRADAECDDGNACTADRCDTATNTCVHTAVVCDDGNACTVDSCDPQVGCETTLLNCDDGDPCTIDSCNPATGCVHERVICPDGQVCVNGTCGCPSGQKLCADGACIPDSGCCTAAECDDGRRCSTDTCVNHVCVHTDDIRNCGRVPDCQEVVCSPTQDCVIISHNERCLPDGISCHAPQCTNSGCVVRDTCGPTSEGCDGCSQCSCHVSTNKCVKSCPS